MAVEAPAKPCKTAAKAKHAGCPAEIWNRKLGKARLRSPLQQLKAVNRGVNALTYVSDADNWGQADYWATPREMFERGGDCEDFATAKYFALRQLGFAAADLRIAVVWDKVDREQHAVLLARAGDRIMVLDNKRADLTPVAVLADRYQLLYSLEDGRVRLPLLSEPASISGESPRSRTRIINGGRTLVMQIQPRRRGVPPVPAPTPPIEMALAEIAVPSGR
jgi:predicted transglutaminase-like cysteine proteinase